MARKPVGRRQQGQQESMFDVSSDEEVFVFAFLHSVVVQLKIIVKLINIRSFLIAKVTAKS